MTKGGRILVVDDETLVRETVGSLLSDEGYVVDQASDGHDAIAKVDAHCPDVILLDLMMPGMNGRQFLDALRDRGHADLPVVVMTAVHGLTDARFGASDALDVIEKPFDLDDLLNKIALAMYRAGGEATVDVPAAQVTDAPAIDPAAPVPLAAVDTALGTGRVAVRPSTPAPHGRERDPDPDRGDRAEHGVVLLVDRDRAALQRLDGMLSARGYTVVSMTRVGPQLPRLARALEPRAIILDVESGEVEGGTSVELVRSLRAIPSLRDVPILVFARVAEASGMREVGDLAATQLVPVDEDLLRFVERA